MGLSTSRVALYFAVTPKGSTTILRAKRNFQHHLHGLPESLEQEQVQI